MTATLPTRMTGDKFMAWAMEQPEGKRYELVAGEVDAMAPERVGHARMKGRIHTRLWEAIRTAGLPCELFPGGIAVRVDAATIYQPDAMVHCSSSVDDNATEIIDPLIVIDVVSASSCKRDTGSELEDYFRIPSVRHYLIVKTENRVIIHHQRDEAGEITTHIIRESVLHLDPPCLTVTGLFTQ